MSSAPETDDGTLHARLANLAGCSDTLLDLSSGLNPYGPPELAVQAAQRALAERYPDPTAQAARRRVAERFGIDGQQIMLGHGATDLAFSCARAWAAKGSVWLAIDPSEDDVSAAARRCGARVTRWRSVERTGHRVDLEQVGELMRLEQPQVVTLLAPGSPTGASVPFARLAELAGQFPTTQFVVNQSWLSLSDDHLDLERLPPPNVVCLRSLSLDHALPGVRAGYALASAAVIRTLSAARATFPASAAAAGLVQAAMDGDGAAFLSSSRERLQADRARLAALLDELGLVYTPSVAHFLLVRIARASDVAHELRQQYQIAVCDATPFGLPDHLRISAVDAAGALRLEAALARICEQRGLERGREP